MKRDRDCEKREVMKKFTFKGVLDNFRTSVAQPTRPDQEIQETLRAENFQVKRVSDFVLKFFQFFTNFRNVYFHPTVYCLLLQIFQIFLLIIYANKFYFSE